MTRSGPAWRRGLAVAFAALLAPGEATLLAQQTPAASPAPEAAAKLSADQLDSLVAPIALYPDDLLAQTLAASTYPLEIMQLQQWLAKHKDLKDKALADAVAKQPWDPAVQSMAAVPEVVKRLSDDIQWTTDLGNAFLAQQADVMDACQRMRKKAKDKGTLAPNEQQKVETKVIETKEVIVIESANPEVIYVPSYSPTVVYPPPVYPYPPIYYPPYYPGAAFVSFGVGVMVGAAFWGGGCCHCGWGHNDININVNNNFNRVNANRNTNVSGNRGGGNSWQHNSAHRGGAPYADRATANRYGGTARGDSLSNRQASARQQQARTGAPSVSNRSAGTGGTRGGAGVSDRSAGTGGGGRAQPELGGGSFGGSSSRGAGAGSSARGGGSSDRIGSRDISGPSASRSSGGGFGSGGGFSGGSARASSSRGASSFGGRSGGGGGGGRRR